VINIVYGLVFGEQYSNFELLPDLHGNRNENHGPLYSLFHKFNPIVIKKEMKITVFTATAVRIQIEFV
jgi:hypothetical protein